MKDTSMFDHCNSCRDCWACAHVGRCKAPIDVFARTPTSVAPIDVFARTPTSVDESNPKDLAGEKKSPLWLVPGPAVLALAKRLAYGAKKYGPYNWRTKKVRQRIYIEAAMRHMLCLLDGEDNDPDDGSPHEAAVMACMAIVIDARSLGKLVDDRPPPGKSADLIRQTAES